MRRTIFFILSIALLCSLVLSSCSGPQVEEETPSVLDSGVLKLYDVDPITLDPGVSAEMTSHDYITQIYSGLVRLDENLEPAPDIAERWEISSDGRTYTF